VIGSLFGLSPTQGLVVLFVLAPFAVAGVVIPLVAWRTSGAPRPVLTSEILANGRPAEAEILSVRNLGNILDARPMVRFALRVLADGDDQLPWDLEVVQWIPRRLVATFRPGDVVEIRLTADGSAGAVVWGRSL